MRGPASKRRARRCRLVARARAPNGPCTGEGSGEGAQSVGLASLAAFASRDNWPSKPSRVMHQAITPGTARVARPKIAAVPLTVISAPP